MKLLWNFCNCTFCIKGGQGRQGYLYTAKNYQKFWNFLYSDNFLKRDQPAINCLKTTVKTAEKCMNLFEVNNKDTRATSFDGFIDFILRVFIINFEHIPYSTHCFVVFILTFEMAFYPPPFSPLLSLVKYNKISFSSIYNKWNFCAHMHRFLGALSIILYFILKQQKIDECNVCYGSKRM